MHRTAVNHLDNAVAEVFDAMLGERCLPEGTLPITGAAFSASVHFTGCLSGVCTIRFDSRAAADLTAALLGGEPEASLDPAAEQARFADTVGELCNMIAGSWKSRLPPELASCCLSSPQVRFDPAPVAATAHTPSQVSHWARSYCFAAPQGKRNFGLELTLEPRETLR